MEGALPDDPNVAVPPSFEPTMLDILVVEALLLKHSKLPIELIDVIIEQAEYWPHSTAFADFQGSGSEVFTIAGGRRQNENRFLVCVSRSYTACL